MQRDLLRALELQNFTNKNRGAKKIERWYDGLRYKSVIRLTVLNRLWRWTVTHNT